MNSITRSLVKRSSLFLLIVIGLTTILGVRAASAQTVYKRVGYFANWDVYDRGYTLRSMVDSGAAARLTNLNYAFANVVPDTQGDQVKCKIHDPTADYYKSWTSEQGIDGQAVEANPENRLRGNFQQLKVLKSKYLACA